MKRYLCLTIAFFLSIVSLTDAQTLKKVLLEEFTGAWVGWDPRGFALRDSLDNAYPGQVIPVCTHYGDPMENIQGTDIGNQFNVLAFPSAMVDRKIFPGYTDAPLYTQDWASSVVSRLTQVPSLKITLDNSFNAVSRLSTVNVNVEFLKARSGSMRIHLFYLEDSVSSPLSTYDQYNNYGQGCSFPDPNNPYYGYPCVIQNFKHRYVFRHSSSPTLGTTGIIPGNVAAGDTFGINYSWIVPAGYNVQKMSLVAFVSTTDHSVLNAEVKKMIECNCSISATTNITNVSGPGCNNGKIKVNVAGTFSYFPTFELYDSLGILINSVNTSPGTTNYTFTGLAAASYRVKVADGPGCCLTDLGIKTVKCSAPSSGFQTTLITSSTARVNWNAVTCGSGYQVQYRLHGTSVWTTKPATSNYKNLSGLQPSALYDWRVATKCTGGAVYSTYSSVKSFTTAPLREGMESQVYSWEEDLINNLNLYPNPASGLLNISFESPAREVYLHIFNATGQIVESRKLDTTGDQFHETVDLRRYPAGLYLLRITSGSSSVMKTFLRQ